MTTEITRSGEIITLGPEAVVEETTETLDIAVRDVEHLDDHQRAVNTAQELIRQRGVLMQDLEEALNIARRHAGILKDNYLPDPNSARLAALLSKYKMDGPREWESGRAWSAGGERTIPARTPEPPCICSENALVHDDDCPRGRAVKARAEQYVADRRKELRVKELPSGD